MTLDAMTQYNLLVAREQGGKWQDIITHLMTPAEREEIRRAEELEISRRRLAYFQKLAETWEHDRKTG